MKIKRILLTGDDGYNSIGTRLLIRALKDKYELRVIATKHQQSGVGGKLSLETGGSWGETTVDGVATIWIEGTPADAMELARAHFAQPFDLILSGINLGINASTTIVSSGTFSAAVRGMGLLVAPRAIAISWDTPPEMWRKKHDEKEELTAYHDYPGKILPGLFTTIFDEKMWGVDLLNINLPLVATNKIRFTKIFKDINKTYTPITVDQETHQFSYDSSIQDITEDNLRYDIAAIKHGYISITPCTFEMTHYSTFERLQKTEIEL